MPSHSHQYKLFLESNNGRLEDCKNGKFLAADKSATDRSIVCPVSGYEYHLYASGGNQPHNNTPLSIAAYGWKRTA